MRRRRGVDDAGRDRAGARDAGGSRGVRRRRRHLRRDGDYIVVVVFVIRILVGWFVVFNRIVDSGRFARAVPPRPRRGRVGRHRRGGAPSSRRRERGGARAGGGCAQKPLQKISNSERRRREPVAVGRRRRTIVGQPRTAASAPPVHRAGRDAADVGAARGRGGARAQGDAEVRGERAAGGRGGTGGTGGGRRKGRRGGRSKGRRGDRWSAARGAEEGDADTVLTGRWDPVSTTFESAFERERGSGRVNR